MRDAQGRAVGFVKILRDQTAARQTQLALEHSQADLLRALAENEAARRELQAADAAKDRFLAVLSHELRNPLASIHSAVVVLSTPNVLPKDRDCGRRRDQASGRRDEEPAGRAARCVAPEAGAVRIASRARGPGQRDNGGAGDDPADARSGRPQPEAGAARSCDRTGSRSAAAGASAVQSADQRDQVHAQRRVGPSS